MCVVVYVSIFLTCCTDESLIEILCVRTTIRNVSCHAGEYVVWCLRVRVCTCKFMFVYAYTYIYVYNVYIYIHIYTCSRTQPSSLSILMYVIDCMHEYAYMYLYMLACICAYPFTSIRMYNIQTTCRSNIINSCRGSCPRSEII